MKQRITMKPGISISYIIILLLVMLGLLTGQKSQGQTAFTITYTGGPGSSSTAPVVSPSNLFTVALTNTAYNGIEAGCSTSSDGQTSYATTITAKTGYNFTITSISGTAYASSAGRKGYQFRISSSNANFTTANSTITCISTSSSCAGTGSIGSLTGGFTTTAGNSCTINVLKTICGSESGGGYSKTRTLVISGTYQAASVAPTVTTNSVPANITSTGATLGGNVTATGGASITANGTVYSITSVNTTPTIGGSGVIQLATTNPSAGTGTFSRTTTTALSVNTQYSYRAYATNTSGTAYGGTSGTTFYTLANIPVAPVVGNATLNSLTVSVGAGDGNPAATVYAIQEENGQYVQADGSLGNSPVFQTATAWGTKTVAGLNYATDYSFSVIARNGAAVITDLGPSASGTTLTPTIPLASLSASPALTELSLDGGMFSIVLQNVVFVNTGSLATSDFTLNNAPPGIDIINVEATSTTTAVVTLSYEGADFDANINDFSISVSGSALSSGSDLTSGTLSITAFNETITVTGTPAGFGNVCINTLSAVSNYTVSATELRDNLTISAPADFEISLSNSPFEPSGPIVLSPVDDVVNSTTIYVRFAPSATGATGNMVITHTSAGVSQNSTVSGTGINTAPTLSIPSSASIGLVSALLGGTISSGGCADIAERGIYWSTDDGFNDGEGTKISETGSFGTGAFAVNVSGLSSNTVIYFKAFATSSIGTAYTTQGSFTTLKPEPSSGPALLSCSTTTVSSIPLNWNDAAGEILPTGYLIKWSAAGFASITDPVDGSISNGANSITVNQGVQQAVIAGLLSNTTYYFKIYAYTNSGTGIDYKTDGVIPQTSCTTLVLPCNTASETVNWNFTSATAAASTTTANLTVGNIIQGNNNGATTLITTTSASSGYAGATGTSNAGAAARTGTINTGASAYFEFTLTPASGYTVTLTGINFGTRSTSTGPQAYALRSSLNSYNANIVSGVLSNTSVWELKSNAGLNISSASPVTFRLYGHSGTGSAAAGTANWRIDDINLAVTVSNSPSPASVGATQNICTILTSNSLGGNTPAVGTGTWSQVSGAGTSTFTNVNAGNSTATASLPGTYVYKWSISNGCATVNSEDVIVNYLQGSTSALLFGDAEICAGDIANLRVAITGGSGPYTVVCSDGNNNFTTNDYNSEDDISVTPTGTTTYSLVSVTSADGCAGTGNSGTAIITLNSPVSITSVTSVATGALCSGETTTLNANGVAGGNAVVNWYTGSNGTGTFIGTGVSLSGQGAGTYYARVTGDCGTPAEAFITIASTGNVFSGTGNWTDNARWSCGTPPSSEDDVVIAAGANAVLNTDFVAAGSITMTETSTLKVNPAKTLSINTGAIVDFSGQSVTFLSDNTGTASLGQVNGTLTGANNVTIERYIPNNGFRSWRLLSVPTYGGGQTIRQAWQEGDANPAAQENNLPGRGTQITGAFTTLAAATAAGFDNLTLNAGMQSWNGTGWSNITSTNQPINNFNSYILFIRGDRSKGAIGATTNSSATTLRTRGTVYTGDQTTSVDAGAFALVPNLYPSAISFTNLVRTGGVSNLFYIWDSKKLNGNSLGMYQTFSNTNDFNCMVSGGSYVLGQPNTVIESGQSFFVKSSTEGTITLKESAKVNGTSGGLGFRPAPSARKIKLDTRLYNSADEMLDANTVVFDKIYSKSIADEDAAKMGNPGMNFAVETDSKILAIEGRTPVEENDIIQFRMWNMQQGTYKLEFIGADLTTHAEGLVATLEDSYLNTSTPINSDGKTTTVFAVNQEMASASANRFKVVFKKEKSVVVDVKQLYSISPNPVENGLMNIRFSNAATGRYSVALVSGSGQQIAKKAIDHATGSMAYTFDLPVGIAGGLYKIIIVSPGKAKTVLSVFIKGKK